MWKLQASSNHKNNREDIIYGKIVRNVIEIENKAMEAEGKAGFTAGRFTVDNLF